MEVYDVLFSILIGGGSSSFILFISKNWLTENIKHEFNERLAEFQSNLEKENIRFQVNQAELTKFKYDKITKLYVFVYGRCDKANALYSEYSDTQKNVITIANELDKYDKEISKVYAESVLFLSKDLSELVVTFLNASDKLIRNLLEHIRISKLNKEAAEKYPNLDAGADIKLKELDKNVESLWIESNNLFDKLSYAFIEYLNNPK